MRITINVNAPTSIKFHLSRMNLSPSNTSLSKISQKMEIVNRNSVTTIQLLCILVINRYICITFKRDLQLS